MYRLRVSGAIHGKKLCLPLHLGVIASEKKAYGRPTYLIINSNSNIYSYSYICRLMIQKAFISHNECILWFST